jgi:hypothetical protein
MARVDSVLVLVVRPFQRFPCFLCSCGLQSRWATGSHCGLCVGHALHDSRPFPCAREQRCAYAGQRRRNLHSVTQRRNRNWQCSGPGDEQRLQWGWQGRFGDGTGRFRPAPNSPITTGSNPTFLGIADLNGDGIEDLIVSDNDGTPGAAPAYCIAAGMLYHRSAADQYTCAGANGWADRRYQPGRWRDCKSADCRNFGPIDTGSFCLDDTILKTELS